AEWNALKFFNNTGEFITPAQYKKLNAIFESGRFAYKPVQELGCIQYDDRWIERHIKKTMAMKPLARPAIKRAGFKVVVDAINGAGSVALPLLLSKLGVDVVELNCKGDGDFVHEPEPTPRNLGQLCRAVKKHKADLGMACDPDADRLALVDENGQAISEELTLTIAVAEVLSRQRGTTVINLSTSRTTADVAKAMNSRVYYSKVGEANVVAMMHKKNALIGGEGNGGVIYPQFHAGRDSLVAAALVLSALARRKVTLSGLVETFPCYYNIKSKGSLPDDFDSRLQRFEKDTPKILGKTRIDRRDGLRFDFEHGWLQLRRSNTEPIFRLLVETNSSQLTSDLKSKVMRYFK
ncbi:MAG: phosphoglucosamine mutase, partial [Candidatus Zixiibacteriota bacterium]